MRLCSSSGSCATSLNVSLSDSIIAFSLSGYEYCSVPFPLFILSVPLSGEQGNVCFACNLPPSSARETSPLTPLDRPYLPHAHRRLIPRSTVKRQLRQQQHLLPHRQWGLLRYLLIRTPHLIRTPTHKTWLYMLGKVHLVRLEIVIADNNPIILNIRSEEHTS